MHWRHLWPQTIIWHKHNIELFSMDESVYVTDSHHIVWKKKWKTKPVMLYHFVLCLVYDTVYFKQRFLCNCVIHIYFFELNALGITLGNHLSSCSLSLSFVKPVRFEAPALLTNNETKLKNPTTTTHHRIQTHRPLGAPSSTRLKNDTMISDTERNSRLLQGGKRFTLVDIAPVF